MHRLKRSIFVITAIVLGQYALSLYMGPSTLSQNPRVGELMKAEVREACFHAVDALNDPELPRPLSDVSFAPGPDVHRAIEMTAALNCYVVTNFNAVCERHNRAYIVDYIGRYYDKMDSMMASARRRGPEHVTMMKEFWNSRRNRDIARTIEHAIKDGKIAKSDFGWSAPTALKPMLDKYASVPSRCAPVRAASR